MIDLGNGLLFKIVDGIVWRVWPDNTATETDLDPRILEFIIGN